MHRKHIYIIVFALFTCMYQAEGSNSNSSRWFSFPFSFPSFGTPSISAIGKNIFFGFFSVIKNNFMPIFKSDFEKGKNDVMEFSKNKGEEFKENFLGTIEGLRRQANDFHTKATDLENKITKISSDASKKDKELDILMHEIEENKKKAEQDLQEALKGANKKNSTLIDQFGSEVHSQVAMLNEAKNNLKEQINSQEQNNQKRVLGLESNLQRLDDLSKGYEEVRKKVSKNSTLVTDKLNNIENQFGTFESGLNKLQNDFTQLGKDREEEGIRKAEKLVKIAIFIEKISNNLALIHERFAQAENKVRVFNEWAAEHEKDLDEIDTLLKDKDVLEIKNNNTKIISFRQNPIETGFYKNGVTNEKFL